VVNVLPLEQYLRGVVPREMGPAVFDELEALKAQAVAARTYALAHLRDYASKGFDVCATPSCQVYRGQGSEHPLTDRAVRETAGVVATWRGRPINAYYTSTCGGHTEEGKAIFDDAAPYLKGVACLPEHASRHVVRTTALPRRDLAGGPEAAHVLALLEALGVVEAGEAEPSRLEGAAPAAEVRTWVERAEGLRAPLDRGRLLRAEEALRLDDPALKRGEALALLAGAIERSGTPALAHGELAGSGEGQLSVLHGEGADSHPIDPGVLLFRDVRGAHSGASELALSVGDRVSYVERGGRVVYLEAGEGGEGDAQSGSRHYRWEVSLTPEEVARTLARYGSVGRVRDIVPKRLGVSGRVVELGVVGSAGELDLKGLRVRWGLGLRENLFVVHREKGPRGDVERFVITGKGWGHGVGLCQVGAFGMAQAGSSFEEILRHYYTGVTVSPRPLL
jgi:stage II sporulation protein D